MTSAEEIAWAAGLFEGEGCLSRHVTTKRSREYGYWQMTLSSTDRDVVVAYQHRVVRQPEVRALILKLRPFMHTRRAARMDEALEDMLGRDYRTSRRAA